MATYRWTRFPGGCGANAARGPRRWNGLRRRAVSLRWAIGNSETGTRADPGDWKMGAAIGRSGSGLAVGGAARGRSAARASEAMKSLGTQMALR